MKVNTTTWIQKNYINNQKRWNQKKQKNQRYIQIQITLCHSQIGEIVLYSQYYK